MLNAQDIQTLKSANPQSFGSSATPVSQPLDDTAFKQWAQPTPVNKPVNTQFGVGFGPKAVGAIDLTTPIIGAGINAVKTGANYVKDVAGNIGKDVQDFQQGSQDLAARYKASPDTAMGDLVEKPALLLKGAAEATTKLVKGVSEPLTTPISRVIQTIGNALGDKLSTVKPVLDIAEQVHNGQLTIEQAKKNYPDIASAIDTAVTLLPFAAGAKVAPEGAVAAKGAVESGLDTASSIASKTGDALAPVVNKGTELAGQAKDFVAGKASDLNQKINPLAKVEGETGILREGGQVTPESARNSAWNDIQPKATAKTKLDYAKAGNVTEQGLLTKGKLTPSAADNKLLDSYSKLYEDGTIKDGMTPSAKQAAIDEKAAQLHGQQKEFLATHDKAVTLTDRLDKNGILDKLDVTAKKSSMPFSKDASAKGAYDSAIDTFKSFLDTGKSAGTIKGATTLSKIDSALTAFDQEMAKFKAWGKTSTGEITDTALARQQAIRDIHTTARDFISSELPPNSPWKAIRLEESNMYQISDRVAQKIADTVGISKVGQVIKNNPVIKSGVKAAGLGAGLHIIP